AGGFLRIRRLGGILALAAAQTEDHERRASIPPRRRIRRKPPASRIYLPSRDKRQKAGALRVARRPCPPIPDPHRASPHLTSGQRAHPPNPISVPALLWPPEIATHA